MKNTLNKRKDEFTCEDCGKEIKGQPSMGMNLGWGAMYFCYECRPVLSVEEIIESMDNVMNPKKE